MLRTAKFTQLVQQKTPHGLRRTGFSDSLQQWLVQ